MTSNIDLIVLLHQRYRDLDDTLARKAAWALEAAEPLQARIGGIKALYQGEQIAAAADRRRAEQAEAKLREAEKDAERYRWLRDCDVNQQQKLFGRWTGGQPNILSETDLDAAIDRALGGEKNAAAAQGEKEKT